MPAQSPTDSAAIACYLPGAYLCENRPIPLAPKVAQTLLLLVEKAGEVVEKEELLKKCGAIPSSRRSLPAHLRAAKAFDDEAKSREFIATISKTRYPL